MAMMPRRQRVLAPMRDRQQVVVVPGQAHELHPERQAARGATGRQRDRREAQQRGERATRRVAGGAEPLGRGPGALGAASASNGASHDVAAAIIATRDA
jgi:hypothetical protein